MNNLLKDACYRQLKSNPTTKGREKVADALKEVKSRGSLFNAQRKSLVNNYSSPPQLYGLPKIHNNGSPQRPIVCSIDSSFTNWPNILLASYKLSQHLASKLQPLVGTTSSCVKDCGDFVIKLEVIDVEDEDMMVSFDVVSLFTRVTVSEALRVIEDLLTDDDTLKTRTTMLPTDITSLTRLCLATTYFQFKSVFYEQA